MRQRANASSDLIFLSIFSHEHENVPETDLNYLMSREGGIKWKQIIHKTTRKTHTPMFPHNSNGKEHTALKWGPAGHKFPVIIKETW
jgi:hypothetical protein